ncbi:MAG: hypothetical protein IT352_02085 [Gemmatimonadales bacterium]|nr:hypothetical protein [Gemmatimonadales bacterium]
MQLERLNALGDWLQVNGDGIFGTRPWRQPTGTTVDGLPIRYTRKGRTLFAFLMSPTGASVVLPDLRDLEVSRVRQLGSRRPLRFAKTETGLSVTLTPAASGYPLGLAIETTGEP